MEITGGLLQVRWEDLVVGEGVQRITVHQVEVEGTLGEEAVPTRSKREGEGARTVVAIVVLVLLVET